MSNDPNVRQVLPGSHEASETEEQIWTSAWFLVRQVNLATGRLHFAAMVSAPSQKSNGPDQT